MADDPKKIVQAPAGDHPEKLTEGKASGTSGTFKIHVPEGKGNIRLSELMSVSSIVPPSTGVSEWRLHWSSLSDDAIIVGDHKLVTGYEELRKQIEDLRKKFAEQAKTISEATAGSAEKQQRIQELESTLEQLGAKERLGFLLSRVNSDAQEVLLESEVLRKQFLEQGECNAFVMSVDIRRSTELMLKARSPEEFARFTTTLCTDLTRIIVDAFGVFDKFTGDGVLAFFPEFYSGPDAAYQVIAAASECHDAFKRHYYDFRKSFTSVLKDVGLGIGIDYGPVRLVQVAGGLTVVGVPVVYACRPVRCAARRDLREPAGLRRDQRSVQRVLFSS